MLMENFIMRKLFISVIVCRDDVTCRLAVVGVNTVRWNDNENHITSTTTTQHIVTLQILISANLYKHAQ